ncbi:MAG TPA: BON domain-containing protein [Nitrospiraceae bacterium]|nr:BON domain-containing protein [Nitrospiraceae bacterium]
MIAVIRSLRFPLLVLGIVALAGGAPSVHAQSGSESKSEAPKTKEPESKSKEQEPKSVEPKAKEPEPKAKEPEPTTRELEHKLKELEQKVKELEPKTKEPDTKAKEPEPKIKEPETKPKEAEQRPKEAEGKPKEPDSKPKDGMKAKEAEVKPKEAEPEVTEQQPCPQVHPPAEKPAADGQPPADKAKPAEAEGKKPLRSPMVTAKLALMADSRLFPYDIEVDTKDKDLVLLGKVGSDSEKRVAADIVRCLDGVHAVENRLKVEPDASHSLVVERDKIITNLVKERFEKSKTLQAVKFDVKTEDGVVTLSGATRFQVIILEAAQAARQVPGVKAVNTEGVRLVAGD